MVSADKIVEAFLKAFSEADRPQVSKMYSTEDEGALRQAGMQLSALGLDMELSNLPHSGYLNVRVQQSLPGTGTHTCCTCTK